MKLSPARATSQNHTNRAGNEYQELGSHDGYVNAAVTCITVPHNPGHSTPPLPGYFSWPLCLFILFLSAYLCISMCCPLVCKCAKGYAVPTEDRRVNSDPLELADC